MLKTLIDVMERGYLPDSAIRFGIRRLCRERLLGLSSSPLQREEYVSAYAERLRRSPLVVHADDANRQHYELPAEFFSLVLGKNRKYSSAFYPEDCRNLDEAEDRALVVTMARAELADGMNILELGCGWGSLTLAMARKFPQARITALSNSTPQRLAIEAQARSEGLNNVRVLTSNIQDADQLGSEFGPFDRIVSVEMFEHLRNYELLLSRISSWLRPEGKLFVHIFTNRQYPYLFETEGEDNWMGRYFFTGGQMPSHDLLPRFSRDMRLEKDWIWNGTHYARTSEDWLLNLDRNRTGVLRIFREVYGEKDASRWLQRWRVFFLSCAELFGFAKGEEWAVSHYLFVRKDLVR